MFGYLLNLKRKKSNNELKKILMKKINNDSNDKFYTYCTHILAYGLMSRYDILKFVENYGHKTLYYKLFNYKIDEFMPSKDNLQLKTEVYCPTKNNDLNLNYNSTQETIYLNDIKGEDDLIMFENEEENEEHNKNDDLDDKKKKTTL